MLHFEEGEAVALEDAKRIEQGGDLLPEPRSSARRGDEGLEEEAAAIPDAKGGAAVAAGELGGEVEEAGEAVGVEVLGVDDGAAGFEGVAGERDGGGAAADDAGPFEDADGGEGGRGGAEEVGQRGAGDAGADDADLGGMGRGYALLIGDCNTRRRRRRRRREGWKEEDEDEDEALPRHSHGWSGWGTMTPNSKVAPLSLGLRVNYQYILVR